jgi:hypothetical protein
MKKYVLFAFIALFFVSSSVWADTAYVRFTDGETVSWIPIEVTIDDTNFEISSNAIDENTKGSIDLNEVWSESGRSFPVSFTGYFRFDIVESNCLIFNYKCTIFIWNVQAIYLIVNEL